MLTANRPNALRRQRQREAYVNLWKLLRYGQGSLLELRRQTYHYRLSPAGRWT